MITNILFWMITLCIAFIAGKAVSKIKLPAILGWLIVGMMLGPNAAGLIKKEVLDATWYRTVIMWMQGAFGIMLGTELVWRKIKNYGKALMVTTLTQSLGTFAIVSLVFGTLFYFTGVPVYLGFVFGGIALATAPAPALSIVSEFHTKGPVTNTLLPMAVLDDIVGIAVFFTVNSFVARTVSGGSVSLLMIPVMILMPIVMLTLVLRWTITSYLEQDFIHLSILRQEHLESILEHDLVQRLQKCRSLFKSILASPCCRIQVCPLYLRESYARFLKEVNRSLQLLSRAQLQQRQL